MSIKCHENLYTLLLQVYKPFIFCITEIDTPTTATMNNNRAKKKKTKGGSLVKAVRIEAPLWEHAQSRVKSEDLDFSKYVRRLIRADLQAAAALAA